MANSKPISELKKRALLAKERMKMGYWQNLTAEKEQALKDAGLNYMAEYMLKDLQHQKFERDTNINLNKTVALSEENFYQKVCEILDSDEDILNPIGRLVDHKVYDIMDETAKQRYILDLSKKYRQMCDRYEREQQTKNFAKLNRG